MFTPVGVWFMNRHNVEATEEREHMKKSNKQPLSLPDKDRFLSPSLHVIEQEHMVYLDGIKKNGGHLDWHGEIDRDLSVDLSALYRHLEQFKNSYSGIDVDSGAHALAHVRARCGIIMDVLNARERKRNDG